MAQLQAATTIKLGMKLAEASASGQVQRVNDNTALLDLLAGGANVEDKDLTTPPTATGSGAGYIVPPGASGDWSTKAKSLAFDLNSAWVYVSPWKGATVQVKDESKDYQYDGSSWIEKTSTVTTAPTWTVVSKTASFTVSLSEAAVYLLDASSSNITVTLLNAASMSSRGFTFKRIDNTFRTVTIDPFGSETIDGQTTIDLVSQYDSVTIVSNGSTFYIL